MYIGGGNSLQITPFTVRAINAAVTAGTNGNVNVGNTTIATASAVTTFIEARSGAIINNAVSMTVNPSVQSGGNIGNAYGMVLQNAGFVQPGKVAMINLQNSSGNGWGQGSTLPAQYYFLENTDTRSKSAVGPIESYYDRPYTFTTTTGTATLDWSNGTSQYLKPTGNVTLDFANAVVSSNGNLFHTVTLVIEQGATPYTITLPTASATIKYAAGISTIPATANAVIMLTSTAANINGSTTYLTTISPEFQ
jgi:hypothetical protein